MAAALQRDLGLARSALLGEQPVSRPIADDATLELEWPYEQQTRDA